MCTCTQTGINLSTYAHVPYSRLTRALMYSTCAPEGEETSVARCQERRPYSSAGTEVPFRNFHPPCALGGQRGTVLIRAAHAFILAWAGRDRSQLDRILKQPGNG